MKNLSGSLKGFISEPKLTQSAINPSSNNSKSPSYVSPDLRSNKDFENLRGVGILDQKESANKPIGEQTGELIVGHGVSLKGAIKECRAIEIKGDVEAEIECDKLVIEASGQLRGSFVCEVADIGGDFSGTATVKDKVLVRSTGCLSGELSYGSIRVELGGRIRGKCLDSSTAKMPLPMGTEEDLGDLCNKQSNPRETSVSEANGTNSGIIENLSQTLGEQ